MGPNCRAKIKPLPTGDAAGFTLVEILVALVIMGVVMMALGPAFYEMMSATASTNQRSVANGLAVAANEQLRSIPYWEVGFNSVQPSCPNSQNQVVFTTALTNPPVAQLSTTQTVNGTAYTLQRCLTWVNASDGSAGAYKQSAVTVTWSGPGGPLSVTETSAIYPGGEGVYAGANNQYAPSGATPPPSASPPSAPTTPAAVDDPGAPTTTIDVTWSPPSTTPTPVDHYLVEYNTTGNFTTITSTYALTGTTWNTGSFTPGSTYYFQVLSVAADGTTSAPSTPVVSASTQPAIVTSCQVSSLSVSPTIGVVNQSGTLTNASSFQLTVNANSACGNVTVGYTTSSSTVQYATVTGSGGSRTGTAGTGATVWSPGNHPFTVYVDGAQYNPLSQVQVDICQGTGSSQKC